MMGACLAVQWLRVSLVAQGVRGTKIPHATGCGQELNKNNIVNQLYFNLKKKYAMRKLRFYMRPVTAVSVLMIFVL